MTKSSANSPEAAHPWPSRQLRASRLVGAVSRFTPCTLCAHEDLTTIWDDDLRGRVCVDCAAHLSLAERALRSVGCHHPL